MALLQQITSLIKANQQLNQTTLSAMPALKTSGDMIRRAVEALKEFRIDTRNSLAMTKTEWGGFYNKMYGDLRTLSKETNHFVGALDMTNAVEAAKRTKFMNPEVIREYSTYLLKVQKSFGAIGDSGAIESLEFAPRWISQLKGSDTALLKLANSLFYLKTKMKLAFDASEVTKYINTIETALRFKYRNMGDETAKLAGESAIQVGNIMAALSDKNFDLDPKPFQDIFESLQEGGDKGYLTLRTKNESLFNTLNAMAKDTGRSMEQVWSGFSRSYRDDNFSQIALDVVDGYRAMGKAASEPLPGESMAQAEQRFADWSLMMSRSLGVDVRQVKAYTNLSEEQIATLRSNIKNGGKLSTESAGAMQSFMRQADQDIKQFLSNFISTNPVVKWLGDVSTMLKVDLSQALLGVIVLTQILGTALQFQGVRAIIGGFATTLFAPMLAFLSNVLVGIEAMTVGLSAASTASLGVGATVGGILVPILLIIGAIYLVVKYWDNICAAINTASIAVFGFLEKFQSIFKVVSILAMVFAGIAAAIGAPIALPLAAIGALVFLIASNLESVKLIWFAIGDFLSSGLKPLFDEMVYGFENLGELPGLLLSGLETIFNVLEVGSKLLLDSIMAPIAVFGDFLSSGLKPLFDEMVYGFENLVELPGLLLSGLETIFNVLEVGSKLLLDSIMAPFNWLREMVDKLFGMTRTINVKTSEINNIDIKPKVKVDMNSATAKITRDLGKVNTNVTMQGSITKDAIKVPENVNLHLSSTMTKKNIKVPKTTTLNTVTTVENDNITLPKETSLNLIGDLAASDITIPSFLNIPLSGLFNPETFSVTGSILPPQTVSYQPHAEGGIVTAPHLGLVGEAGPEAIIPLDRFIRDPSNNSKNDNSEELLKLISVLGTSNSELKKVLTDIVQWSTGKLDQRLMELIAATVAKPQDKDKPASSFDNLTRYITNY